ncbi:MAG: hypothetical protein FWG80_00985 [Alphaproteobacteria bacterium]|nr:hypothetical protein [Alphaproteobacteria bacterium]
MNNKKSKDYRHGHRERVFEKLDSCSDPLSENEVLEALLFYAIPRIDTKPVARELLKKFGGFYGVLTASSEKLLAVPGIGSKTARLIKLIRNASTMKYENMAANVPIFHESEKFENYCRLEFMGKTEEEFHIIYMDAGYRMLAKDIHSRGTSDETAAYPIKMAKRAIELNAKVMAIMHNHPGGTGQFSDDDIKTTADLKRKLDALEIVLYDHYLVADGKIYSAKNSNHWETVTRLANM